jgi:hypothetical protein
MGLLIRNSHEILCFVRKNKIKASLIIIVFPVIIGNLYEIRGVLRSAQVEETTATVIELVVGKLVGRLSSFSDTAVIIQETSHFENSTQQLNSLYFYEQAFSGIFGVEYKPIITPENLLINLDGGDFLNISFMTGLPGNLYMAWLKSPFVFFINLLLVIFMILITFILSRKIGIDKSNEYALILLLMPLTSGVSNEFSSNIIYLILLLTVFLGVMIIRNIAKPTTKTYPLGFQNFAQK